MKLRFSPVPSFAPFVVLSFVSLADALALLRAVVSHRARPPLNIRFRLLSFFLSFFFFPQVTTAEEENAFADALDKFAEHLNNDKMKPDADRPGDEQEEPQPVAFTFHSKFPAAPGASAADGGSDFAQAAAAAAAAATSARRVFPPFTGRGERKKPDRAEPAGAGKRSPRGGESGVQEEVEQKKGGGLPGESSGGGVEAKPTSSAAAAALAAEDAAVRDDGPVVTRRVGCHAVRGLSGVDMVCVLLRLKRGGSDFVALANKFATLKEGVSSSILANVLGYEVSHRNSPAVG